MKGEFLWKELTCFKNEDKSFNIVFLQKQFAVGLNEEIIIKKKCPWRKYVHNCFWHDDIIKW